MRYFLDTEFSERGPKHPIELISIGVVAQDGRELYAVSSEFEAAGVNDWVRRHVLSNLTDPIHDSTPVSLTIIREAILSFIGTDKKPEFWGYYSAYDWVVFCQVFGSMVDLPKGWPMYCRDLKQWCDQLGNPKLPTQGKGEHNALSDARWNWYVYAFLGHYQVGDNG